MRSFLLVACAACSSLARAEEGGPGETAVLDALEARAREALARIRHPLDAARWQASRPRLLAQLEAALGIKRLPEPAARGLRQVGVIERPDHVVEKLVWETLPGSEVPAHLYRPRAAAGRLPAVLFVPGHWWADSKSRPDFQAFSLNLARLGFVVLAYDPFGQGERGISWRDHRRTETLLAGVAQQAIVDYESLCALEVLLARVDVDPERIGITGASGGGYASWVLAALDPRIKVVVPVVGTSEFLEQIQACRPLDWYDAREHCHFVPGLLRFANNHELLTLAAPRPLLVIAAHKDESFPLPGIREVVGYGEKLYAALGVPERLGYFEDADEGHGYQRRKREAAYGWLLRWLAGTGDGRPVAEPATETLPWDAAELRSFPPGENRPAGPAINSWTRAALDALPRGEDAPAAEHLERALAEVLGLPLWTARLLSTPKLVRSPAPATPAVSAASATPAASPAGDVTVERVTWTGTDGVTVPAILLSPPPPWKGALLGASDAGKEALLEHAAVRAALEAGHAVLLADPRGLGELRTTKEGWVFAVSLLLGESFVGRQALDLLAGWRGLLALPALEGKPIGLLGSGPFASLAATATAVLEPRAAWLVAEGGFASFRSFAERERSLRASYTLAAPGEERTAAIDREIPAALVPFDVLRRFDIADLLASLAPRPALVALPLDGDHEPLDGAALEGLLARGRFAWRAASRPRAAVGPDAPAAALRFLREEALRARAPPAARPEIENLSRPVERGAMPERIHVLEDYETDIEKRWWMAGKVETQSAPGESPPGAPAPGAPPPGGRRAARGTLANSFDDILGDQSRVYTAVILNPVPGPPMGKSPRLAFRVSLSGADWLRVQIYSLSRGYHRYLTLRGLPEGEWQSLAVDMTAARRPDGSGGPLSEDERIDDLQFYTDAGAELLIDDIILYDAALPGETEPFPARPVFCGWFDTGAQGAEWPGAFEIVPHEPPRIWKAARSIPGGESGSGGGAEIRVGLRGRRPLAGAMRLRFRYRLDGAERVDVALLDAGRELAAAALEGARRGAWSRTTVDLASSGASGDLVPQGDLAADEVRFAVPAGATLLVDDILLYGLP
jgi:dienelactone hydrolase